MSASERLAALDAASALEKYEIDLFSVLPEIVAVVQTAEQAERKLWCEYRRALNDLPEDDESWAEGEALAATLAVLEEKLTDQSSATPVERATPPSPDPCLVSVHGSEIRSPTEKDWREARNCPRGCGSRCAALEEKLSVKDSP